MCVRVCVLFREEHNQRKINDLVTQAKAKMAKGDKKGTLRCTQDFRNNSSFIMTWGVMYFDLAATTKNVFFIAIP